MGYSTDYNPGKLIDRNQIKYIICTQQHSGNKLDNYYVQCPYKYDGTSWNDGLGVDGILDYIKANSEYTLKTGEYLLLNYTSSSDDDSSSETVENKVYEAGEIIKPNFDLYDSVRYHNQGHSYPKTSGYKFETKYNPDGMYTLGTSDQIEIRKPAEVVLKATSRTSNVYLYWTLNDGRTTLFPTDESGNMEKEFSLEDGEYIYYTDADKLEMAYYGSGTKVVTNLTNNITLNNEDDVTLDASTIMTEGIKAVPWVKVSFRTDQNITLKEYQYISIVGTDDDAETTNNNKIDSIAGTNYSLSNEWEPIKSATYYSDGSKYALPIVNDTSGESM